MFGGLPLGQMYFGRSYGLIAGVVVPPPPPAARDRFDAPMGGGRPQLLGDRRPGSRVGLR